VSPAQIHPEHHGPDGSVHGNSAPVQKVDTHNHDHGSRTLAILALIFGVSGTVLALAAMLLLYGLWNRQTLLQIFYNDIKTELIARGMNPHPHMPSESP
jgi:hypothetical protein